MKDIKLSREHIGEIDAKIAKLFEERMQEVKNVAEYKIKNGLPIFNAQREADLILKNSEYLEDDEIKEYYSLFQKYTMEVSKKFQHKLLCGQNVAYSGVEGAFAHIAASRIFPDGQKISYKDFPAAYNAVECGECDCAVLPIENSNAGDVGGVIDLIFSGPLFINDVYSLRVHHSLLALPGAKADEISTVISHRQALDQCNDFIRKHNLRERECVNTARAAKMVSEMGDMKVGAIASNETAKLYGLEVIKEEINQADDNTTRFAVFSRSMHKGKNDHSIITFVVPDKPGALAKAINIIGNHGFNMRCIKSRATKVKSWSYYFYVELGGNLNSRRGQYMLDELSDFCESVKFVGTFNLENKI